MVNSIEDAMALSESSKKPVLLIFGSNDCVFCEKLKQDIIRGELTKYIDEYIVCYLDIDKAKKEKQEYKVSLIPDSRILRNKIEKTKIIGYKKSRYIEWLENAKQ